MHTPLTLRVPTAEDFAPLAAMRRDQSVQSLLLTVPAATDDAAVRDWIERRSNDPGGAFRVVVDAGEVAGFVQVAQVRWRNGTGYGGIALMPSFRGRGLGRPALRCLIDLAAQDLGLFKLIAEIRADNLASVNLHLAMGYREVGRFAQHFVDVDGQRHDVRILERLLSDTSP